MPLYIRNRQELENLIITKRAEGDSIRGLSRRFKISRNTVRKILRANNADRDQGHSALPNAQTPRKSKLDDFDTIMEELLSKYPNITGVRMFEELTDAGFSGGKTIVYDKLKEIRPSPKKKPVIRFETDPGKQGQMDWSPYTIYFTKTGKQDVLCFSYVLGFSRRQYIDFTTNRQFHTLIRRHQDAFEYFGGVPSTCLYDGEKTVILRWEAGQPVFNPSFIAFITHYQCRPIGCRPGHPETKGKVEAPFQYVEKNFLNARDFYDLADLRAKAKWWLSEKSDIHIHDTTRRMPIELFIEQEKEALQPLPMHPYDTSEVSLRVCRTDGFLEHETNLYSVPYDYVADILTLKATEHEIFIYSAFLKLIAHHERLPLGACQKKELPEHRKSKKVRYGIEPVKEAFLQLGSASEDFVKGLQQKNPRNGGFHARYILRLKEHYHAEDINHALKHATFYHAFDGKAVERILNVKAQRRTLEFIRNEKAGQILQNVLPEIRQRSLNEYSQLLYNERAQYDE